MRKRDDARRAGRRLRFDDRGLGNGDPRFAVTDAREPSRLPRYIGKACPHWRIDSPRWGQTRPTSRNSEKSRRQRNCCVRSRPAQSGNAHRQVLPGGKTWRGITGITGAPVPVRWLPRHAPDFRAADRPPIPAVEALRGKRRPRPAAVDPVLARPQHELSGLVRQAHPGPLLRMRELGAEREARRRSPPRSPCAPGSGLPESRPPP